MPVSPGRPAPARRRRAPRSPRTQPWRRAGPSCAPASRNYRRVVDRKARTFAEQTELRYGGDVKLSLTAEAAMVDLQQVQAELSCARRARIAVEDRKSV